MGIPLRVLIVEDSDDDALLLVHEIRRGGYDPIFERVDTAETMSAALADKAWDIILADYVMPQFSGLEALKVMQRSGIDLPFIVVSGKIVESTAIETMKAGAHDYIMKGSLAKLIPTVRRELREADERRKRNEAERALRESEERFRVALKNSSILVFNQDRELRYTWIYNPHPNFCNGTVLGKTDADLFQPDEAFNLTQIKRQVLETGIGVREEVQVILNGEQLFYDLTVEPLCDPAGVVVGITCSGINITERKLAEEEIRLLQTMTQAISEAPDFHSAIEIVLSKVCEATAWDYGDAWFPSKDGSVLECSPAWYGSCMSLEKFRKLSERFTFPPGTGLPGRVWDSKKVEWVQDLSICSVTNYPRDQIAKEAGLKACMGVPIIVNDQVSVVLVFYMFERRDEDKLLVGIISAIATQLGTVIQHKQVEERIREQATLLDKAQDAIIVQDLEHRITYWNKGAMGLYGWTAEEATGKNADELLYKEEPPELIEANKSVTEEGEWMGELRQITKDGKEIIVESHWTLVHDNQEKLKSILIINTDITEKKKLQAQLLQAQRMESIGTLAGGLAHNINNMLTPMMLSLQMLRNKFTDEESQRLLNILEKNTQYSADLIKQVMSFTRGIEGERKTIQVTDLISDIEKIAKETFPKSIEVRAAVPEDLWNTSGDATQLYQVLMNICMNARDAMPDGGVLNISAENLLVDENYARVNIEAKAGSYVVIAVSDTGTSIPPKVLDRIFEPFFTTKEFGKGTGLGLSVSLAIVKSHGGFINVHSETGKGTTFRIHLPALITTEIQKTKELQFEMPSGKGELILVVDDEVSVRDITSLILETNGYKVITADDGAEAITLYLQYRNEIKTVIMDMMMPVMEGTESVRALHKINPEIRIIAASGLTEKDKLAKVPGNHVKAFLSKPYNAEVLLKTIYEVLSAK